MFISWVAVLVAASTTQAPQSLAQIPVFPGAVRDAGQEAEHAQESPSTFRVYRAKASIDDVARFYRQRLAARAAREDELNQLYETMNPGTWSPVLLEAELVNLEGEADSRLESGHDRTPKAAVVARLRSIYTRARTPFAPGQWLKSANFAWAHRRDDATFAHFSVGLNDAGLPDYEKEALPNDTEIVIEIQEDAAATGEAADEPAEKPPLTEPSAAELGVPRYPGARYDARISGGMSSDEERYSVYTTVDAVDKVVSFYERATGKPVTLRQPDGSALIAVVGSAPLPALGVTVQRNVGTYPAAVKTVITVRRATP